MGRGLDGFSIADRDRLIGHPFVGRLCSFQGPTGALARRRAHIRSRGRDGFASSVALAWGKHLFPFRTEKLSPTAPMVLVPYGTGRVGRRRFLSPPGRQQGGPRWLNAP